MLMANVAEIVIVWILSHSSIEVGPGENVLITKIMLEPPKYK